jgi:hypothetical protein
MDGRITRIYPEAEQGASIKQDLHIALGIRGVLVDLGNDD